MLNFIKNIRSHYRSILILRNNPDLLNRYNFAPMSLYILETNQSTDIKLQEDYNMLHKDYKYHGILGKESIPFGLILANPQYIKKLKVFI